MLSTAFLIEFKRATETMWRDGSINPHIYGFQFQRGTRWVAGLSDGKIVEFEDCLGTRFPHDFRSFLLAMNGTDLPTLNVYGSCGEPPREGIGVYSYPRDLETVKRLGQEAISEQNELTETLL